uniref:Uncharacterized protein n=1 Tax=Mustela putorius furo TaxID=9669 RepID=M3YP88_MUSPF
MLSEQSSTLILCKGSVLVLRCGGQAGCFGSEAKPPPTGTAPPPAGGESAMGPSPWRDVRARLGMASGRARGGGILSWPHATARGKYHPGSLHSKWASTGLLGRGGVGWELSVPGPAGTLRAGQRSARPHPAPHRSLRPGEPWGSPAHRVLPSLSCGMPCASQRTEEEARSVLRQQRESQLSHSTNGPQPPPPPIAQTALSKSPRGRTRSHIPWGMGCRPSIACCQPSPKATTNSFRSERTPCPCRWATSTPSPSRLLGAHVLGETPNSKLPFRDPGSHSWMGREQG